MDLRYKISGFLGLLFDLLIVAGAFFVIVSWYLDGKVLGALGGLLFFLIGSYNGLLVVWFLMVKCGQVRKCNRESES